MAYDKHTWTCDEPITVERLNHIEDGIANAGGGDCGFECEEGIVTLTEESVTTTAGKDDDFAYGDLSYSQRIDADSITVTFDGVEYECPRVADSMANFYGAPWNDNTQAYDWSEYPFAVVSDAEGSSLATETAGTYSIKIEVAESSVTTTSCFEKAVKSVMGEVVAHMTEAYDSSTECTTYTLDITDDDVRQIVESGSKLKIIDESNCVYYPVNIWARDATSAVRANQPTARVTIILQEPVGTPLMLETMTTTMTPRYLTTTVCSSTNSEQ